MTASTTEKKMHPGRTLFSLGFGYFIDQAEAQAMSVLTPIILTVFNVTLGQMGLMTTLRTIMQTVSAPIWGYTADKVSRKNVLILGTGIWGIWTLLVGLSPNFETMIVLRTISGLGLGCLMPATFSLIADHFPPNRRGFALGMVGLVGLLGTVGGVLALGFVASEELWRWGFVGLGLASLLSGFFIWWLVEEPPRGAAEPELAGLVTHENESRFTINIPDVIATLRIPTIWAAIIQGVTGTMPWVVMGVFLITWLVNDLGYENGITLTAEKGSAPLVFAAIAIGVAISNLMGGIIGDYAERISPRYGRTAIGQFSVLIGVPLTYILFTQGASLTFPQLFGLAFGTALLIGWPGRGAKEPMMQAVVPPELRGSGYAVVNVIEGGLSASAGIIAGTLADTIGLQNAMLWTVPFPWLICGIFFTMFYFTYPKDAERVRAILRDRRDILLAEKDANT